MSLKWPAWLHPPQPLRRQFSLAILALSLLVLSGGLTVVQALRNFSEISGNLAEERLKTLQDAQNLVQNTLLSERESYRMLTTDSLAEMQESYKEINRQMASLDTSVSSLGETDTDATVLALNQSAQLFRNTAHIVAGLRQRIFENGHTETNTAPLHQFQKQLEAQVMMMALEEDDYVRQFVAPADGVKRSTFFDTRHITCLPNGKPMVVILFVV